MFSSTSDEKSSDPIPGPITIEQQKQNNALENSKNEKPLIPSLFNEKPENSKSKEPSQLEQPIQQENIVNQEEPSQLEQPIQQENIVNQKNRSIRTTKTIRK